MQHSKTLYAKGLLRNRKMLTQSENDGFKFVGRLDHIKTFAAGIKSLSFAETGSFQIGEDGFRVTAESGKTIQATLFITPTCFSQYQVEGILNFSLNMNVIIECLSIFTGIDCSLKIFYKGHSAPLVLILEPHDEEDIQSECSIKTSYHDEPLDFEISQESPSLNCLFVRGTDLASIFHELDKTADEVELTLSPQSPYFKIATLGVMQAEASVEIAKSSEMISNFKCRATTKARYKSSQLRLVLKALSACTTVAIKTDASGLLEMHFVFQSDNDAVTYVQFFLTPLADIDL